MNEWKRTFVHSDNNFSINKRRLPEFTSCQDRLNLNVEDAANYISINYWTHCASWGSLIGHYVRFRTNRWWWTKSLTPPLIGTDRLPLRIRAANSVSDLGSLQGWTDVSDKFETDQRTVLKSKPFHDWTMWRYEREEDKRRWKNVDYAVLCMETYSLSPFTSLGA